MKDTPHILIFPGWYPTPLHPFSGDFVQFQADMLQREGFQLSIMHLDLDYRYGISKIIPKYGSYVDDFGLQTFVKRGFGLPKKSKNSFLKWSNHYLRLFETYKSQLPDHLIVHAHNYMGGLGALALKKKYGIPYVITEHSTSFLDDSIPVKHHSFLKEVLDEAEIITAVSHALNDKIKKLTDTEVRTIPNFIDTDLFQISENKYDTFTFVFAGNLIERKNPNLLIDAFQSVADQVNEPIQLVLLGDGKQMDMLRDKVTKSGIRNVIFKGQQNIQQVAQEIGRCHTLVLTSYHETFGLVLAEALSCGIPIISTPSGGPADIVNDRNGVLLQKFSKTELVESMKLILENLSNYHHEKLRSEAINLYSVKAINTKLKQIYGNLT